MAVKKNDHRYEELYSELLGRGEQLHESNKKRIRRGIGVLIALPFILYFILWMTDSDKVVFLLIWVLIMFVVSAYLISIEYLDSSVEKTLRDVIDAEEEFDELLPHSDLQEKIRERIAERRLERMSEEIAREALLPLLETETRPECHLEELSQRDGQDDAEQAGKDGPVPDDTEDHDDQEQDSGQRADPEITQFHWF